jgi:hypothetical protein
LALALKFHKAKLTHFPSKTSIAFYVTLLAYKCLLNQLSDAHKTEAQKRESHVAAKLSETKNMQSGPRFADVKQAKFRERETEF